MRSSSAVLECGTGLPVGTALGKVLRAAGVTVGDAIITLRARSVANLARCAGRGGVPTSATRVAVLQCAAGALILIDRASGRLTRSPRAGKNAKRTSGATFNVLPLRKVIDECAFLDICLSACSIAPSGNRRARSKTTCRRSQIADLTCCAGIYRHPGTGCGIALFARVTLTTIFARSRALRLNTSTVGGVTKNWRNANRLRCPSDEIEGTNAQIRGIATEGT